MDKEVDINVIKATQLSLGKHVKRPPLTEKLLKKPPFRFLHDIVITVLKTTGFFEGLFEAEELVSDNVKDRESKILFLNKVITVLALTTGKPLSVKSSKIIAGQESEKTNELLQCLAQALDDKLSTTEAVEKFKHNGKSRQNLDKVEKKTKEDIQNVRKKENSDLRLKSKSTEKLTKSKRDTNERSLTKNDKEMKSVSKSKQNKPELKTTHIDTKKTKTSKPPKKSQVVSDKQDSETIITNSQNNDFTNLDGDDLSNDDIGSNNVNKKNHSDSEISLAAENTKHVRSNDDSAEVNKPNAITTAEILTIVDKKDGQIDVNGGLDHNVQKYTENNELNKDSDKIQQMQNIQSQINGFENKYVSKTSNDDSDKNDLTNENSTKNSLRPPSGRPSSSRPGAPRLRERNNEPYTANDNLLLGKVNVIIENTLIDEDEDTSLIVIEKESKPSRTDVEADALQMMSNQHGHLVQQILDSQKEYSQVASGKAEIEWEFNSQKAKEASSQEIEKLRFNIEALSRISNPLGKLLDHIQEDVEVMRQELQQWTEYYHQAAKELAKQKMVAEESLLPMMSKLKQLNAEVEDKCEKITDLKIIIHRNSSRINNLLASGDVQ